MKKLVILILILLLQACWYHYTRKIDPKTIQLVTSEGAPLPGAKLQLFDETYLADSAAEIKVQEYRDGRFQ